MDQLKDVMVPIIDLLGRAELGLLASLTMSNIYIMVSRFPFPSFLDSL